MISPCLDPAEDPGPITQWASRLRGKDRPARAHHLDCESPLVQERDEMRYCRPCGEQ